MDNQRVALASHVAPKHTAVLVVDVQPMFTAMPLLPALDEVLPRLRRFLDAARAAGVPRVFIRHVIAEGQWTEVWQRQHASRVRWDGRSVKAALAANFGRVCTSEEVLAAWQTQPALAAAPAARPAQP